LYREKNGSLRNLHLVVNQRDPAELSLSMAMKPDEDRVSGKKKKKIK
jgi:hypothetical protein